MIQFNTNNSEKIHVRHLNFRLTFKYGLAYILSPSFV